MRRVKLLVPLIAALPFATTGWAQSGSSSSVRPAYQGSGSSTIGSGTAPRGNGAATAGAQLAMDGYCPVCLASGKGWVAGSPEFQAVYDGQLYRFPKAETLAAFQADPVKYTPALGGDDLVEFARTGRRVTGKLAFGAIYLDRNYFFASEANKEAFRANATRFANADLAAGGACVVCRVDMRQEMAGSTQFVSLHKGMRYQFLGAQQQQAFESRPARYAVAPPQGGGMKAGSGGR